MAFATGGMHEVTAEKLALLDASGPVSTASDHTYREHVVLEAIHRAGSRFNQIICVGDGLWDVRAAIATGSQLIGIGPSTTAFGEWFPSTHLYTSFNEIDVTADFTLRPPAGTTTRVPNGETAFTARPALCGCWN